MLKTSDADREMSLDGRADTADRGERFDRGGIPPALMQRKLAQRRAASRAAEAGPDEQTLFGDGEAWDDVHQVEAETAQKATTETPDTVHQHKTGTAWSWMPGFGVKWAYNKWYGSKPEGNEALVTQLAREQVVAKLGAMLATSVAVTGFKIDLVTGLVTADSIGLGPMLFDVGGRELLLEGARLDGLEVQFSLGDVVRLARGGDMADAVTIRFTSLTVPRLQIGAAGQADGPARDAPAKGSGTDTPPSGPTTASLMMGIADSLRLGFHVGAIDLQLLGQEGGGVTLGVAIRHGALRTQLNSKFWAPVAAMKTPPKKVTVGKESRTVAELEVDVRDQCESMFGSPVDREIQAMAETHLGALRAALADEALTPEERVNLLTIIAFLEGDHAAFDQRDAAAAKAELERIERTRKETEARRAKALELAKQLPERDEDAAPLGGVTIKGVHAAVVGQHVSASKQTSGSLHLDAIEAHGLDATTAGGTAHLGRASVGPIDVRLLQDQLGLQIGGAKATDLQGSTPGGETGGAIESLALGRTRLAARVGGLDQPEPTVDAVGHLGSLTAHSMVGSKGDAAMIADHVYVGPTDVNAHKHGPEQHVDARGLAVNVRGVHGALDRDTAVDVASLRLAPSALHGDRTAPTPGVSGEPTPAVTGGSVTTGALDLDGLDVHQPRNDTRAQLGHLGIGTVAATVKDTQGSLLVRDVEATKLHAEQGPNQVDVGSVGLDRLTAVGDTSGRQGDVGVGTLTATRLAAVTGRDTDAQLDGSIGRVTVGPTDARLAPGTATVGQHGIRIDDVEATRGATEVSVGRLETGKLDASYRPEGDHQALTVDLARLAASKVELDQVSGGKRTHVEVGRAELRGPGAHLTDHDAVAVGLDGVTVEDLAMTSSLVGGDRGALGTAQAWETHEQRVRVAHLGLGGVGLTEGEREGHTTLGLDHLTVEGVDQTVANRSDDHTHQLQKATLARDAAIAAADTVRQVEIRKATALAEANRKQGKKGVDDALGKAIVAANDTYTKAKHAADKAFARIEKAHGKAASKEAVKGKDAATKVRGSHAQVGSLELASLEADLTGVDQGAPQVESVALGGLTATGVEQHKTFDDDVERMTVDVEDITLALDAQQTGRVTLHLRMGSHMLENLIGGKTGAFVNGLVGLDGNRLTLTIDVAGGLIDLGTMTPTFEKHWLRGHIVTAALAKIHVGGDKAKKSLGGEHSLPHLHAPGLGDRELEQLGLDGVHQPAKQVLVSRSIHGARGGVHLKHLLENGLQAAIDGALGADQAPPEPGAIGLSNVTTALASDLDVRGVELTRRTGREPGKGPVDDTAVSVASLELGGTLAALDEVTPATRLVQALGAMLTGVPPSKSGDAPTTATDKPVDVDQARDPGKPAAKGPLDGVFAMLEALLGGAATSTTGGRKGGGAGTGRALRNLHLDDATGQHGVDVFNTGGGGDCGIHAMFGQPQGGAGTVRAANPDAQRDQLADALRDDDPLIDQAAFTSLFVDLVLQLLGPGAVGADREREAVAFTGVAGFWDAVVAAKQQDDLAYGAHGADRDLYLDGLVDAYVIAPGGAVGDAVRAHLVGNIMHSNSPTDAVLRGQLEGAVGDAERQQLLQQAPPGQLRTAIGNDLDTVVAIAESAGAPAPVRQGHAQLGVAHALLGGGVRGVVTANLADLLHAYAGVVRAPGYYLHAEDLQLLARLNHLDLHVYREHDQHPGQFVEQLHQPDGGGNRVDVFHSGVHYERARHT